MGIFSRMKRAIQSKANAAVDKAIDPAKQLELTLLELEEQRKTAYKELLGYKTTAKQMEQDIDKHKARIADLEKKAIIAVKAGKDDLAKQCLREKQLAEQELVKIKRDRDEAAGYAIELNKSRKQVETRLQILKLKKGTMATQIAAARSGKGVVFGEAEKLFEQLDQAGERIDDDAIMAEVQAAMDGDEANPELEAKLLAAQAEDTGGSDTDDALAALKAQMATAKQGKLPPKPSE